MSAISPQQSRLVLEPGTLWARATRASRHALQRGALQPIATTWQLIDQGPVRFLVRMASHLARKRRAAAAGAAPRNNPFLPYDPDLHVSDLSSTHVCLLNKYNISENHLLIVTRHFEDQESLLTPGDFQAMWACMAEFDSLAFYNSGVVAGASQPHKHLQVVPLPLVPEDPVQPRVPVEPLLDGSLLVYGRDLDQSVGDVAAGQELEGVALATVPGFRFAHALVRIPPAWTSSPDAAAVPAQACYLAMLRSLGVLGHASSRPRPYNLVATREWMLVVPRATEHVGAVSINALGFAGSIFVRDREQLDLIEKLGPMTILERVAA